MAEAVVGGGEKEMVGKHWNLEKQRLKLFQMRLDIFLFSLYSLQLLDDCIYIYRFFFLNKIVDSLNKVAEAVVGYGFKKM